MIDDLEVHKILEGADAGRYLPFARSRMAALVDLFGTEHYFEQTFTPDGAIVVVRQSPPARYIHIIAGVGAVFEFATSGKPPVSATITVEGQEFKTAIGCMVRVALSLKDGAIVAKPRIPGEKRTTNDGADQSIVGRIYQTDLFSEPVRYPQAAKGAKAKPKYPVALYDSYAPVNAHTGLFFRSTVAADPLFFESVWGIGDNTGGARHQVENMGVIMPYDLRDVGLDVPFQKGINSTKLRTAYLRDPVSWPRACGLQIVKSTQFGNREYAIYVDVQNLVSVFPTSQIKALDGENQNVDEKYVKHVELTFPDWCHVPTRDFNSRYLTDGPELFFNENLVNQPELDWQFSHDGKRMATIVYERRPFDRDATFWDDHPSATIPMNDERFAAHCTRQGIDGIKGGNVAPGYDTQYYFIAPGAIEVQVQIKITGEKPEDFEATCTLDVLRDPSSSDYCPIVVGYVWYDLGDLAQPGDLVFVDVEHYGTLTAADGITDEGFYRMTTQIISVKNRAGEEMLSFKPMPLAAVDLSSLSFYFEPQWWESTTRTIPPKTGTSVGPQNWVTIHTAAAIFTKGEFREILYPESMDGTAQAVLADLCAGTGRDYIDSLPLSWEFVPLTAGMDGLDITPNLRDYRKYWSYIMGLRTQAAARPGNADDIEALVYGQWRATTPWSSGLAQQNLWLCDVPLWGWHTYEGVIANMMWLSGKVTFYAHPKGSYALYHATTIYAPDGYISGASGDFLDADGLGELDPTSLEHVIFDRVHFELEDGHGNTIKRDTSFVDLYNQAVAAADPEKMGTANLHPIAHADMQAHFAKLEQTYTDQRYGILKATWQGGSYYHFDWLLQSGAGASPPVLDAPGWGSIVGISFDDFWSLSPAEDIGVIPSNNRFHIHFANPLMVGV